MKKLFSFTFCLAFLALPVFAQENTNTDDGSNSTTEKAPKKEYEQKTLLGNSKISHGGYIAPSIYGTQLNGEDAIMVGGRLSWLINHRFGLGIGGYGLTNTVQFNDISSVDESNYLEMGYGGLYFEPIIGSKFPVHVSFPILVAAGGAGYYNNRTEYYDSADEEWVSPRNASDAFFVIEPGMEVELNVVKYFRFAVGASYRYVDGLKLEGLKSDALNGLSVGATFKVGFF